MRFGGIAYPVDRRKGIQDLPLLTVSQYRGVLLRSDTTGDESRAEDLSNYKVVQKGQLVINRMSAYNGALGVSPVAGVTSPDYMVLQFRSGQHGPFWEYLMRSPAFVAEISSRVRGIGTLDAKNVRTPRISYGELKLIEVPSYSIRQQVAIADYLDRETKLIDQLIEKQYALVDRLRGRRGAQISAVLTAGLQPEARQRESGIPFLGSIPAHWRTVPTRYLCRITTGSEDSGNADPNGKFPFFVRGREILRIGRHGFNCEAVMTPGDGQGGTGKVFHYYSGKFEAHQRVYVFHRFKGVLGRYFYLWLSTFLQPIALAGSNTVTMESLRRPVLANFRVALPPLDEQAEALEYLDRETAKIDMLIAKAEKHIELARERRSALVTAAVTGQIDVGAA